MVVTFTAARARLVGSPLAQRLVDGAAWSIVGTFVSSGFNVLLMILVARVLGKETYGQFVVIQSTLNMAAGFAGFGVGTTATRYAAELRGTNPDRLRRILTLAERTILVGGLITSALLVLAARWAASSVLNEPALTVPLATAASAVLFAALDGYQKSVLVGLEAMRSFAAAMITGAIVALPIMFVGAQSYGLEGAAVALTVSAVLQAAISRFFASRELASHRIPVTVNYCMKERAVLWRFALPALLSGQIVSLAHWTVQALLANTANGFAELAVFGVAMQWFNVIVFLPATAGRVILPILTEQISKNDQGNSRKILLYAMSANALFGVPMAVLLGVLSPYIMTLYGAQFKGATLPLILATSTAALLAIQMPVGNLILAANRMWLGALMNAGWAAVYIGIAFFLVANGATGAWMALAAGYIVHAIWTSWFAMIHGTVRAAR